MYRFCKLSPIATCSMVMEPSKSKSVATEKESFGVLVCTTTQSMFLPLELKKVIKTLFAQATVGKLILCHFDMTFAYTADYYLKNGPFSPISSFRPVFYASIHKNWLYLFKKFEDTNPSRTRITRFLIKVLTIMSSWHRKCYISQQWTSLRWLNNTNCKKDDFLVGASFNRHISHFHDTILPNYDVMDILSPIKVVDCSSQCLANGSNHIPQLLLSVN